MTRWCRAEFVSEPRGGHGVTGSRGHGVTGSWGRGVTGSRGHGVTGSRSKFRPRKTGGRLIFFEK